MDSSDWYGSPVLTRIRSSVGFGNVRPLNTFGPPSTSITYSVAVMWSYRLALYNMPNGMLGTRGFRKSCGRHIAGFATAVDRGICWRSGGGGDRGARHSARGH